ncbi:MAG TPA: nucleoside hydrolase [Acidimicrobiales bacterium]|nr:nucleoside hydrolase [Acidimicrobiales bacterium]
MTTEAAPWALVCDPGIDDAVALAVLAGLGAVPDLVVAVPGNVTPAVAARNAGGLVALLGLDVTVRAYAEPELPARDGASHGEDGLGGVAGRLPPTDEPDRLELHELPRSLLVTGPLTCAAAGPAPERLLWMGGAVAEPGNVDGVAEFNAWCDPAAVDEVLAAVPVAQLVPLDVTRRVRLREQDLAALEAGGEVARLLAQALRARPKLMVHDAVAAVAWLRPELFAWEAMGLRCDRTGALVPGPERVPVEVALRVDVDAVRGAILAALLA